MHEMFRLECTRIRINFFPMCANHIFVVYWSGRRIEGPQKLAKCRGQCVNTMCPIALSTLVYLIQFSTTLIKM